MSEMVQATEEQWHVQVEAGDVRLWTLDQLDAAFKAELVDESTFVLEVGKTEWMQLGTLLGIDDEPSEPLASETPAAFVALTSPVSTYAPVAPVMFSEPPPSMGPYSTAPVAVTSTTTSHPLRSAGRASARSRSASASRSSQPASRCSRSRTGPPPRRLLRPSLRSRPLLLRPLLLRRPPRTRPRRRPIRTRSPRVYRTTSSSSSPKLTGHTKRRSPRSRRRARLRPLIAAATTRRRIRSTAAATSTIR